MRILRLESENVKRLKVVQITPTGELVVVGGRNGQGKSSVLDSIEMALGGKRSAPSKPVRDGQEEAHIVCDLGDIIVRRSFTADGKTHLSVESKDGAIYSSPQTMLDKLVGQLSFDPLSFSRLDTAEQFDVLCKLVGLDLADFDARSKEVFDERTAVNRGLKQLDGQLAPMKQHADAPAEEVSITALSHDLRAAQAAEKSAASAGQLVARKERELQACDADITKLTAEIARLQSQVEQQQERATTVKQELARARDSHEQLRIAVPDMDTIHAQMAAAEETNRRVRANAERAALQARIDKGRAKAAELKVAIDAVEEEKRAAIAKATFPVTGLSVSDDRVTFGGVPFDQASSAEQLRASVAIGLAMNPKLRVLLIRDGSLLDEDGLRLVGELAAAAKAQVWIERVSKGSEVTVLIEDGSVVGAAPPSPLKPLAKVPDDKIADSAEAG
jgi:DNA repair exonuclease SbcCD ATPase subunit